ncbi:MAG: YhjD/YihY/BrkB family envelope integrity protein [Thioalkalispiraceae bacterium]
MRLNIKTLKDNFQHLVWDTAEDEYPPLQRRGVVALRILYLLIRDLREGQLNLRAMGLVYTTLLAIVPLIAVSFSVLKGFGVHNQVEPLLLGIMEPLGEKGIEITERIIGFVDNIKAGILGSLGLAFLIYTVVSLLQKIERAFNFTWRVTTHRPLSQRFSDYITLILIGPVLIFSALGVTASVSNIGLLEKVMQIEAIGLLLNLVGYLVPFILIVTIFSLVYKLVPNVNVKFKSALVGAVVAGLLWQISSWAFTNFVVGSATKYTAIYSAFATLIIFMIWLYLNWLILLIGCSVSFYYQYPEQRNLRSRNLVLSNRLREKLALHIMVLIARHFYQHKAAWTLDGLAKRLHISGEVCDIMVNNLLQAGLLVRTADDPVRFIPGYAIETITVNDIVSCVREAGESPSFSTHSLPGDEVVDGLFSGIEEAIHKQLAVITLHDLLSKDKSQ